MGFDAFTVVLTTNRPVYFSGQTVEGYVRAVVSSETSCRKITATFCGKGKVKWTETRNKRTVTYTGEEQYGRNELVLWSGNESDGKIGPGNHTFPFMFTVPMCVPSSFQSGTGNVHYEVKAVADIPWGFDEEEKAFFPVHCMYDLNQDGAIQEPLIAEKEEEPGCGCCCVGGNLQIEMNANRRGFVPGEVIKLNGRVSNRTLSNVKYSQAKIVQTIQFHATSKTKTEKTTVARVYRPSINPHKDDVWTNVPLTVPAVTASGLTYCNIIDIVYHLEFVVKIGSCTDLTSEHQIIIGSVPLQRYWPQSPNQPALPMGGMPSAPYPSSAPGGAYDQPPPYSSDPPPYSASNFAPGPYDPSAPYAKSPYGDNDFGREKTDGYRPL